MNHDFMRLLARLERVPWVEARVAKCKFADTFEGVNGFFMATDLMAPPDRSDVLTCWDWQVGSIAAWAAILTQEQSRSRAEDNSWIKAPAELEAQGVNELSWRVLVLGLGKENQSSSKDDAGRVLSVFSASVPLPA